MRKLLIDIRKSLNVLCPTFIHVPPEPIFPHITLEPGQNLKSLPWGPHILMLSLIIWSRYKGTREILKITKSVEAALNYTIPKAIQASLKISESNLIFHQEKQTRTQTFRLKIRYQGNAHD